MSQPIFISHSSKDDDTVRRLGEILEQDNTRRAIATAELIYIPADDSRSILSERYEFVAPQR